MSEVQKYLDCGCALLVGGERVWCPSCSGAAFDADPPTTVVDAKQRIADLERQLAAMNPVVEAAVLYAKYNDIDSGRDLMDAVSDYEARKPK